MSAELLDFEKKGLEIKKKTAIKELENYAKQLEYLGDEKNTKVFSEAIKFFIEVQSILCGPEVAFTQVGCVISFDKEEVKKWYTRKENAFLKLIDERAEGVRDLINFLEKGAVD